jgi:hypothetical protein
MSHSVGFEVSIKRLAQRGQDGKDAIASAIVELESVGYLVREQLRNADGTLASTQWTTKDPEPWSDNPLSDNPLSDNPHLKKNNNKNTEIKNIYAQHFESFWSYYPRKVGRGAAKKAFTKAVFTAAELGKSDLAQRIIKAAMLLAQDPNLPNLQFVPHAVTWLNREGWEDEPYPEREKTAEERAEASKAQAQMERERRLMQSRKLLDLQDKEKASASAPPKCEHGASIVSCRYCLQMAKRKGN